MNNSNQHDGYQPYATNSTQQFGQTNSAFAHFSSLNYNRQPYGQQRTLFESQNRYFELDASLEFQPNKCSHDGRTNFDSPTVNTYNQSDKEFSFNEKKGASIDNSTSSSNNRQEQQVRRFS